MILKDLYDLFNAVEKDRYFDKFGKNGMFAHSKTPSMTKIADDAIFQFPVLVSQSVSEEDLDMVTSVLEYAYANFVLTALSLDAAIDNTKEDTNVRERLRRYHQNNTVDYAKVGLSDNDRDTYLTTESSILVQYSEDFATNTLNEDFVKLQLKPLKKLNEAKSNKNSKNNNGKNNDDDDDNNTGDSSMVANNKRYEFKKERNVQGLRLNMAFTVGDTVQPVVLGVKCVPHRLPSEEIIYFAGTATTDSRHLFRFIQWTTGEISLVKDFILNIKGIMKRAEITKKKSFWWDALRYRSILSDWKRFTYAKDQILPNSTVVLTMEEVEMINNEYHVNLFKSISSARNFIKKFFLISLVILDPANENAYILYDSQNDYQYYTYSSLKKEPETQDKTLKAMIALAQR